MITFQHDRAKRAIEEHSSRDGTAYYASLGINAEDTLRLLCKLNRYVLVNMPPRCEQMVRRIERETGASVLTSPTAVRLQNATLAVIDAPLEDVQFAENCVVINVREL